MSTEEIKPTKIGGDEDGDLFAMPIPEPYTDQKALHSAMGKTPNTGQKGRNDDEVGPVKRASAGSNMWNSVDLRSFVLNSAELATTIRRFRDEMYRNEFPVLAPKFEYKCKECDATYDSELDECEVCESQDFATPSKSQKYEAKDFFKSVNKEGQSLRSLMEYEEDFQSFFGISVIIARKTYRKVQRDISVLDNTVNTRYKAEVEDLEEFVHGDPMSVVPVTDENNRHGGWWMCPMHRSRYWEQDDLEWDDTEERPTSVCPDCSCELEEVGYVEVKSWAKDEVKNLYLKDEVIDWARHFPVMNGLDGRSPVMPLVKLQALVQFNRTYEMAFFDPENTEQLPNKMLLAYGQNIKGSLSATLSTESDKGPWETGQFYYEGDPEDVDIEVLDLTPQDALSGRQQMAEKLQSQIRAMFGVSDAMENELSDTGGLNAEGTQIEVTNRSIASAHADTADKALDKIAAAAGLTDWKIKYVDPKRERHELTVDQKINAISNAKREEVPYEVSDGQLLLPDHDFDPHADDDETDDGDAEELDPEDIQ